MAAFGEWLSNSLIDEVDVVPFCWIEPGYDKSLHSEFLWWILSPIRLLLWGVNTSAILT